MEEVLIFEEEFDDFDLSIWEHEITMGGSGNWEFEWYTNNRSTSYVEDGKLFLQPRLTSELIGEQRVTGEVPFTMDIWGMAPADVCTSNEFWGCSRSSDAGAKHLINPIQSAKVRTANSLNIKYGRVEVRAKLPRGDWLWPAIWMMPRYNAYGNWPASGEIDIVEAKGNGLSYFEPSLFPDYFAGGYDTMSTCVHWGTHVENDHYAYTMKAHKLSGTNFNADFHTFGLYWDEKELYTYLDSEDNRLLEVSFNQSFYERGSFADENRDNPWRGRPNAAPFDQPFYLIMNVAVGGVSGYFPDGVGNKPWSDKSDIAAAQFYSAKDQWYPTWNGKDSALQVDSVRVWQKQSGISFSPAFMMMNEKFKYSPYNNPSYTQQNNRNTSKTNDLLLGAGLLACAILAFVALRTLKQKLKGIPRINAISGQQNCREYAQVNNN